MRFESSYIGRTGVPPVKMYKYHRTSETLVLPDGLYIKGWINDYS